MGPRLRGDDIDNVDASCAISPRFNFQTATFIWIQLCDLAARMRPSFAVNIPALSRLRACGTPDAQRIRSLVRKSERAHERSHHEYAEIIRRSARNGWNGVVRGAPGERSGFPPFAGLSLTANTTFAPCGNNDRRGPAQAPIWLGDDPTGTTHASRRPPPARSSPGVLLDTPDSNASAATASRPASVTIANAPRVRRDEKEYNPI